MLDHLRHLLAEDPTLTSFGLPGGLSIWLFRNTQKVFEWAGNAKDDWQMGEAPLLRMQIVSILDYLDGLSYVQHDAPGQEVSVSTRIAQIPLLQLQPDLIHPAYLAHIGRHLLAMRKAPGISEEKSKLVDRIIASLNQVAVWLKMVHDDAKQLVTLNNRDLLQPSSLVILNRLAQEALFAFVGRMDLSTNQVQKGVAQISLDIQQLSSFEVKVY